MSQGGHRITVEVLVKGFLLAYDVVMSGLWHGQSRPPTEVQRSGLSASRWTSVGLGVRGTAAARARRRLRQVDDGRVPIVPTRTTRGEVIATVAVVPSARGDVEAVAVAVLPRKPAQRATFGDYISAERERLRGGESLSSEAMVVKDVGFSQDRGAGSPEGLGCERCESREGARLQQDVAIDEVLRQKRLERQELKDQMQPRKSTRPS